MRDQQADRIEDLEEALRRIVTVMMHSEDNPVSDADHAAMVIALDQLDITDEPFLHYGRVVRT